MTRRVLLLHPPATKAGEPPPGTAVLLAHLRRHGVEAHAVDANLGAYLHLLSEGRPLAAAVALPDAAAPAPGGAATPPPGHGGAPVDGAGAAPRRRAPLADLLRAASKSGKALATLRSERALESQPRYTAAVRSLNLALSAHGVAAGERLTLGDYNHGFLDPYVPDHLDRLARGEEETLFAPYFREVVLPEAAAFRPDVVGFTVTYRNQLLPAFELAGLVRRALPGATLVAGGGMVTSLRPDLAPAGTAPYPFDRVVFGPGEAALLALARGEGDDGPALASDPSAIEFEPDYSFRPPADYLSPVPVLPVASSRGCYWHRCLFCPEAVTPTHPYREYPPAEFPDLLLSLAERYGARHFHVADNAVPPRTLKALAERAEDLASAGIRWHGFARFEPLLADPALCARLAKGGCASLHLGLESGSPAVLEKLRKGTDLAVAERILHALRGAGAWPYVYVLLGTPGETEADGERTLAFLERNADAIGWLNLSIFNLPRESVFASDPEAHGIRLRPDRGDELRLYKAFDPESGWGRDGARRFLQKRILGSPALRAIARRTPPLFTSNHAFLFPPGPGREGEP